MYTIILPMDARTRVPWSSKLNQCINACLPIMHLLVSCFPTMLLCFMLRWIGLVWAGIPRAKKLGRGYYQKNQHESGYRSKQKVIRVDILHMYKLSYTQQTTHHAHTSIRARAHPHPHQLYIYIGTELKHVALEDFELKATLGA
jgi:hypothetical protein